MSGSFFFLYVIHPWNVFTSDLYSQTQENVWKRSCEFRVTAASSQRKWSVKPNHHTQSQTMDNSIVEFVPIYDAPQLFRWKGYWVEIKRSKGTTVYTPELGGQQRATMYLTWASTSSHWSLSHFLIYDIQDIHS